jgi:threonyl-tRNA synthetase
MIVVGDKEVAANQLAVRTRGSKDLGSMSVETFLERLQVELSSYGRRTLED